MNAKQLEEMSEKRANQLVERLEAVQTESAKAFMLLNSAAVAAMLGFIQALAGKTDPSLLHSFKPFAVVALVLFLAGAAAAAVTFSLRLFSIFEKLSLDAKDTAGIANMVAMMLAPLFFVAGGAVVVLGVVVAV